jgi:uncharacterized HhH-GPD family protein
MDPARVTKAFATPPAIHRFPVSMAGRVQALCALLTAEYGGDPVALWRTARDAADLKRRIGALPGFGPLKSTSVLAVLIKQFGVDLPGSAALLPTWPTLADVNTAEERRAYQAQKRAHKAQLRAAGGRGNGTREGGAAPGRGVRAPAGDRAAPKRGTVKSTAAATKAGRRPATAP